MDTLAWLERVSIEQGEFSEPLRLYHYSDKLYPSLQTRRKSGLATREEIKKAEASAKQYSSPGPYVDHISFFFDPLPLDILPTLYAPEHRVWFKGNRLYEYVVDVEGLPRDLTYHVVESVRKTAHMDRFIKTHNWVDDDPVLLSKYLKELKGLQLKWGELGRDWFMFKKKIRDHRGTTRDAYIKARQREDFEEGRHRYATNVPHVMLYLQDGEVQYSAVNTVTVGNIKRVSLEQHGSYTVDDLLEYVKGKPVITVNLDELKGQYPHNRISKKRLENVVIDGFPIIVKRWPDGRMHTLDGFHRAYKAIQEGRKTIKAVLLTDADIALLKKQGVRK